MKNINRRPRTNIFKKCGGVLLSLCNISLIGVGFSSWVIRPLSGANVNIDVSVSVVDTDSMLNFISSSSSASFSKYGFVNYDGSLTDTYTFVYSFTLNQKLAKSAGYIDNGNTKFKASFSDENKNSKFIALFEKQYIGLDTKINYNGQLTQSYNGSHSGHYVTSVIELNGINDNFEETIELQVNMTYISSKLTAIQQYFSSLSSRDKFSFNLDFEVIK